jgi:hypothetical protein
MSARARSQLGLERIELWIDTNRAQRCRLGPGGGNAVTGLKLR